MNRALSFKPALPGLSVITLLSVVLAVSGCATHPRDVAPYSHSPAQYQTAQCRQIADDRERLQMRAENLYEDLRQEAVNDRWQLAVGVVFWPTLLLLDGGENIRLREYADLSGRLTALQIAGEDKGCQ
jgi:hypothetical protein